MKTLMPEKNMFVSCHGRKCIYVSTIYINGAIKICQILWKDAVHLKFFKKRRIWKPILAGHLPQVTNGFLKNDLQL